MGAVFLVPRELLDPPDVALGLDRATERGEVVLAEESFSGTRHRIQVERPADMPHKTPGERVTGRTGPDQIAVAAPLRREAG